MIKLQEMTDPRSCLSRARDDEMVFVLLERDVAFEDTLRFWAKRRVQLGKNSIDDEQIKEALTTANNIEIKRTGGLRNNPGDAERVG